MKTQALALDPTTSLRRWLFGSLMLLSVAGVLALKLTGVAHAGFPATEGPAAGHGIAVSPAPARLDADPALDRLVALHLGATRLSALPALVRQPGGCCQPAAGQ